MSDFIVVGAGSAGSVITRRLLDAGASVTLVEAGGSDDKSTISDIGRAGELWLTPDDWGYYTTPQEHLGGRRIHWPRGKVLGGSHSLNASIYVRGAHGDYDRWAREGATGWAWDDVLPVFKRIENFSGGESELRGAGGPLDVTLDYERNPIFESIHEAYVQAGVPANPDYNGESIEGVAWMQLTTRGGRRLSSYRAYLHPVIDHERLTVRTAAWTHRVIIENGRAVGVVIEVDGRLEELRADQVVLSAGALDTPRILMLSGVGPAAHLAEVGVDVVADVPGVGENLHDHVLVPFVYETTARQIPARTENEPVAQLHSFTTFRAGLDVPDTQPIIFSVPMVPPPEGVTGTCFTLHAGLVRPESRGTYRLASNDPSDLVLMDPHTLERSEDVKSLRASMRQMLEVGSQPALVDEWGARLVLPNPVDLDDAALDRHMRQEVTTYHHQVGTCRMGTDEHSVVNPSTFELNAGIEGLRIADASIMPSVPSGNTNAPSIMIGERASDVLTA
ncbi:GMC oxidoreductase [Pseudoclavibacter endophyticus]|uniref:Oxidoreductase n=1 Tax=Pseudoclavibacter endophyticus TaxID=1778590 RepID=A0A6H9WKV2_9MICO|nr:GMC family oxidoreductase N-terminal domain-containing protein [Pseudoclavibacter endophyticus]KAB1648399.1 oxidoreductase [Pseudoclavibacter endophyticus]GGA72380.1 GMC oxidoreductase [Pseudoclavibacter endophyticus]